MLLCFGQGIVIKCGTQSAQFYVNTAELTSFVYPQSSKSNRCAVQDIHIELPRLHVQPEFKLLQSRTSSVMLKSSVCSKA